MTTRVYLKKKTRPRHRRYRRFHIRHAGDLCINFITSSTPFVLSGYLFTEAFLPAWPSTTTQLPPARGHWT